MYLKGRENGCNVGPERGEQEVTSGAGAPAMAEGVVCGIRGPRIKLSFLVKVASRVKGFGVGIYGGIV